MIMYINCLHTEDLRLYIESFLVLKEASKFELSTTVSRIFRVRWVWRTVSHRVSSGLSILLHGVISLQDATSYDNARGFVIIYQASFWVLI